MSFSVWFLISLPVIIPVVYFHTTVTTWGKHCTDRKEWFRWKRTPLETRVEALMQRENLTKTAAAQRLGLSWADFDLWVECNPWRDKRLSLLSVRIYDGKKQERKARPLGEIEKSMEAQFSTESWPPATEKPPPPPPVRAKWH